MNHAVRLNSHSTHKKRVDKIRLNQLRRSAYSPFLDAIPDAALSALTEKAMTVNYPKQVSIVTANHETNAFYIILSGKVRVFVSNADGKEMTLSFQEPGTYFGEAALLSQKPMPVNINTLQKTVCAVIAKKDFLAWLTHHPEVAFILLGAMSQKIKQLTEKLKQMSLLGSYGRMANILEAMAVAEGDVSVIYNMPSQAALASMVGASRKTVNKLMVDLNKGGYVGMSNNNLVIHQKLPSIW